MFASLLPLITSWTEDSPRLYCTWSFVLKKCLIHTAHAHLYLRCAWFVLHILACTAHPYPTAYSLLKLAGLQFFMGTSQSRTVFPVVSSHVRTLMNTANASRLIEKCFLDLRNIFLNKINVRKLFSK